MVELKFTSIYLWKLKNINLNFNVKMIFTSLLSFFYEIWEEGALLPWLPCIRASTWLTGNILPSCHWLNILNILRIFNQCSYWKLSSYPLQQVILLLTIDILSAKAPNPSLHISSYMCVFVFILIKSRLLKIRNFVTVFGYCWMFSNATDVWTGELKLYNSC